VKPWLVADLLILNTQMPRSLASCYENITRYLGDLGDFYGRQAGAQRAARALHSQLTNLTIEQIFQDGLHEFVQNFLTENAQVGVAVTEQYLA
jgi:uncharacterized alpha-E superfamily protein